LSNDCPDKPGKRKATAISTACALYPAQDGNKSALINFGFMANDVVTTDTLVETKLAAPLATWVRDIS
jgi:hypothetical protein